MAQRTCSLPDCDRKHRARGFCSTHYNQQAYPDGRHFKQEMRCIVCDGAVTRVADSRRAPCCSVECRTILQHGIVEVSTYDWARDAMRRARRAGCENVERVEREDVLERDGRRCYICDVDTNLAQSPFDSASATVDHVVPLTQGGSHTLSNMRCACLGCNSRKRDTLALVA